MFESTKSQSFAKHQLLSLTSAQVRLAKFKSLVNKLLGMNRIYGLVIIIVVFIIIIIIIIIVAFIFIIMVILIIIIVISSFTIMILIIIS